MEGAKLDQELDLSASPADETTDPTDAPDDTTSSQDVDGGSVGSEDADDKAGSSSADDDAKGPVSLADAIKAAVEPKKDETSSTSTEGQEDKPVKDDVKASAEDGDGDDGKPPPFHDHPRWKAMIGERDDLKGQVETMTPMVERYQKISNFAQQYDLRNEEISAGFNIMALMRTDPARALEALMPYVESLEQFVGKRLPEDLQDDVEAGRITEERAQELAAAKQQANFTQLQNQQYQARTVQRDERSAQIDLGSTVQAWVDQWKKGDLDFEAKHAQVADRIELLVNRHVASGKSLNRDAAIAICEQAKGDVDGQIKSLNMPKPKTAITSDDDRGATGATAEPKSLKEAVAQAAAGNYRPRPRAVA